MTGAGSDTAGQIAVRCRSISKSYGSGLSRTRVLRDVEFEAALGDLTFIRGPSGSGKTTLLSIIAGVLRPDSGGVEIFSRSLYGMRGGTRAKFRSRNIGFVLQQFNLLPALDLIENVAVPLQIAGSSTGVAHRFARLALARVGIADLARRHPPELSVGQQQRVAVARAIVHSPRLIICDEPTGALDGATGSAVMQTLRDIAASTGTAIIVVTHDHRAMQFADRVYRMSGGSLVDETVAREEVPGT